MTPPAPQSETAPEKPDKPEKLDARAAIGTTIAGRYRVESLLGEGGMGAVYLAYHTGIHRQVALKLLWPKSMIIP